MEQKKRDRESSCKCIVITRDGSEHYGPFENSEKANEWADLNLKNSIWQVKDLQQPNDDEHNTLKKWKETVCGLMTDAERDEGCIDLQYWRAICKDNLNLQICPEKCEWTTTKCNEGCCEEIDGEVDGEVDNKGCDE